MNEEKIIISYDEDFDPPNVAKPPTDILEVLGGARAFWAGVALSILIQMSIGFLILLAIVL